MDEIKTFRQSNIELCRIFAILLVLLVHSNFGWCGWPSNLDSCRPSMLLVEALSIIGVNVFILITGYFSANLKTKSMINLLYICVFYALLKVVVGASTGHFVIKDMFFISGSNWFIPSYIGLLLLSPWLNALQTNKCLRGGYYC